MKKGQRITYRNLELPPGVCNDFYFIGQGAFTIALQSADDLGTIYLRSKDNYKEALAEWAPETEHTPEIERLYFQDDQDYYWYKMPFYCAPTTEHKRIAKRLQSLYNAVTPKGYGRPDRIKHGYDFLERTEKDPDLCQYHDTLCGMFEAVMNYGDDAAFEFSPRNIASNHGVLIFLDVLFSVNKILEIREAKSRARTPYRF
jgi:hypothetical protein